MTKNLTLEDTAARLRGRDNILIITHIRPDGDTLGSAAALCSALRRLGKRAYLYKNPGVTDLYLPFVEKFFAPADFSAEFIVSVDTASTNLFPEGFSGGVDLAIDHHPSNSGFAAETYVDGASAACGEIILELVGLLAGPVSKEEADLLFVAVSTDTGCFQYSNVTARTHLAAAELIERGADSARLTKLLFRTCSRERLALEGYIYSNMASYHGGKINIITLTNAALAALGVTEDDMEDIAALPGRLRGGAASVTIRENRDGTSKVSLRTTEEVNASRVCAKFGGGGHAAAAGATIKRPPREAAELMRQALEEALVGGE